MQHITSTRSTLSDCGCTVRCGCEAAEHGCVCARQDPAPHAARLRRVLPRVAAAFAALSLVAACAHGKPEPKDLDLASVRLSEQGTYRVSYKSEPMPIPVHRMHSWTLHVETKDGRPVTDATLKVDGDMPQHGHGLPTRPRVTRNLGNGDYLVEGVKFQMGGWWVMEFAVAAAEGSDVAKFNLKLQ